MKSKKAFLLLELLLSSVILCIAGVAISQTFSKEIEMTGAAREVALLLNLAEQKLFDIEFKLREAEKEEDLDAIPLSGSYPDYALFSWNCSLKPIAQKPGFYEINVETKGLKREVHLVKWVKRAF